jgi:hypothetical protein
VKGGKLTMTRTIKEGAQTYQPKSAKNITELESVDVNLAMAVESGTDMEGETYTYNYIEVNNERYRVPDSVLKDLKAIMLKKPTLQKFTVSKSGEGRQTRYQVIPLD